MFLTLRHSLQRIVRSLRTERRRPNRRHAHRPRLLGLEDRLVLSTLTVTSSADSATDNHTLRYAVDHAQSGDTIQLTAAIKSPIVLTLGELVVNQNVTIESVPARTPTISGDGISRVFEVSAGATVTLDNVNIIDGNGVADNPSGSAGYDGYGGAILDLGTLTVKSVTLSGNSASVSGGGVYTSGSLTVTGVTFNGNTASGVGAFGLPAIGGGAIDCIDGTLAVAGCTFTNNRAPQGGGGAVQISNEFSTGSPTISGSTFTGNVAAGGGAIQDVFTSLTVSSCTFTGNDGTLFGGAINNGTAVATVSSCTFSTNTSPDGGAINSFTAFGGSLNVSGSTFTGNTATSGFGGAITNNGHVDLLDSSFTGNSAGFTGGAVSNSGGGGSVSGCNFSGNHAGSTGGGGISVFAGSLTIANSTFEGNSTANEGGGLLVLFGSATVTNCTFNGNSATYGGGIFNFGTLTVTGSTLSANTATVDGGGIYNLGTLAVGTSDFMGNTPDNLVGSYTDLGGNTFS